MTPSPYDSNYISVLLIATVFVLLLIVWARR
ncbi:MAG: hypothetical protein JWM16_4857 [Verrucomicrobiales bacterium]|nr:hypothetical protein [Verrucomicrobiales bacterium]